MLLTLGRRAPSPDRSLGYQCLCGGAYLPWLRWWWFFQRPAMQPATEGRGQQWISRTRDGRPESECAVCRAVSYQQHLILPLRRWLNRSQPWHSSEKDVRPSVHLSNACIATKQNKDMSRFFIPYERSYSPTFLRKGSKMQVSKI